MKEISKKIWDFIDKYKIWIFVAIITILAFCIRISLFSSTFGDYEMFIEPWFNELKEGGGLLALGKGIGNYNAPYMTILALLTYLPIPSLISVKLVSVIFDFICAIAVAKITLYVLKDNKHKSAIALVLYGITLFLPTVFLNSAFWGQADSIYTAFILLSLLYLMKQKYIKAFVFLGVAFAFKLQFIFILPLFILIYISERKFSIFHFAIPVVVNFAMCLPSIIFGNTLTNCLNVYIGQVGTYNQYITLNFPNIYSIFFGNGSSHLINSPNDYLPKIGILVTLFIFVIIAFLVLYKKPKFTPKAIVEFGLWSVMICTFFLPHMHDRYLFVGDVLAIVFFLFNRKKFYVPILVQFISMYGYMNMLFSSFELEMKYMGIAYLVLMIIYSKDMYKIYFLSEK